MKGKYVVTHVKQRGIKENGEHLVETVFDASTHRYEWLVIMGTQVLRVMECPSIPAVVNQFASSSLYDHSMQFWEFSQPCIIMYQPGESK